MSRGLQVDGGRSFQSIGIFPRLLKGAFGMWGSMTDKDRGEPEDPAPACCVTLVGPCASLDCSFPVCT